MNLLPSTINEFSLFFSENVKKTLQKANWRTTSATIGHIKDVNHLTPVRYPHKHSCRYVWGSYVWVQTHHSNIDFRSISSRAFLLFPSDAWTEFISQMKFCSQVVPFAENGPSLNLCNIHKGKATEITEDKILCFELDKRTENSYSFFCWGLYKYLISYKSESSSSCKEPGTRKHVPLVAI